MILLDEKFVDLNNFINRVKEYRLTVNICPASNVGSVENSKIQKLNVKNLKDNSTGCVSSISNDKMNNSPKISEKDFQAEESSKFKELEDLLSEFNNLDFESTVKSDESKSKNKTITKNSNESINDDLWPELPLDLSNNCPGCQEQIYGKAIKAIGKMWHQEHFNCKHCSKSLIGAPFFENNGFCYCETDHINLFAKRCFQCKEPIIDSCISAMNHHWHQEHFICVECHQNLSDNGVYHESPNGPNCTECYSSRHAKKCTGCDGLLLDSFISAVGGHWHEKCFRCSECGKIFEGGGFYEHEGNVYCELHYHNKRGSSCASCHQPIVGRCVTAMKKKFHPDHFVCFYCQKSLDKCTFKEHNGYPYCTSCHNKLLCA